MKKKSDIRVNTLIIGAGRSGTTSLYAYLKANSGVCFSFIKEVPFFSLMDHYLKGEDYYHSFFRKCGDVPVVASADTYLLMDHEAISRVYSYNPEMKMVVMLRHPVHRAYSSYHYSVNFGHHKAYDSFLDSMEAEQGISEEPDIVKRNNLGHFYGSLYHEHLSRWVEVFSPEQFLLLKTGDLRDSPEKLESDVCAFLGLEPGEGALEKVNAAAAPRNRVVERLFMDRDHVVRKLVRALPRGVKQGLMRSGAIDRLHAANRREESAPPLSGKSFEQAMLYFRKDLQRLKKDFGLEF